MSFAVEKDAWTLIESGRFKLTCTDKLVLMKVAFWTNGDMECWHGTEAIAEGCDAHRSTVIDSLRKLAGFGLLSRRTRQKKGRGRDFDVIVVDLAATSPSANGPSGQQGRDPLAATSPSTVQQRRGSRSGSNKASENGSENGSDNLAAVVGNRRRNLALPSVGGLKLTEDELALAAEALEQFNLCNGSKLKLLGRANNATESLKRIVMRLREVDLTAEEVRTIVEKAFENPYWSGPAKVGNIFGPKAFQGAVVNDGVARSSRRDRRSIDREGQSKKGPSW